MSSSAEERSPSEEARRVLDFTVKYLIQRTVMIFPRGYDDNF